MRFTVTSPAFEADGRIPPRHTCDGTDEIPLLTWADPPEGTRSFALIMDDPDAPAGTFTHWVAYDIPAQVRRLSGEEAPPHLSGRNDFQGVGYGGPCPPANHGEHRYFFTLFALDLPSLDLPGGAAREAVEEAMAGHVLATAQIMGRYQR